jgi:hypothetical protein
MTNTSLNKWVPVISSISTITLIGAPISSFASSYTADWSGAISATATVGNYVDAINSEADTATYLQADNSKLVVSVPSEIHVKVNGDGTFITPAASAAALKNLSIFSIHVSSVTSSFIDPFISSKNSTVTSSTNNVITYDMGVYDADTSDNFSSNADVVNLGSDATPSGWVLTKKDSSGANLAIQHSGNIANVASDLDLSSDMPFVNIHWVFAAGGNSDSSGSSSSIDNSGSTDATTYILDTDTASISVTPIYDSGLPTGKKFVLTFASDAYSTSDFSYLWKFDDVAQDETSNCYMCYKYEVINDISAHIISCTVTEINNTNNSYTYSYVTKSSINNVITE